jgi:thiol-disulfide isomerase/thioredoxin
MRRFLFAAVYTLAALGANAAAADPARLAPLLEGDMRKLVLHAEPRPVSQVPFTDRAGAEHRLGDWRGKVLVVNFWATWCAPCRKEMPMLDALQAEFGGDRFAVLTVATGRNALPAIDRFFAETGVQHLPVLLDPRSALARDAAVLGLPATLVIDAEGHEIGRMVGEADWAGASARALVSALLAD